MTRLGRTHATLDIFYEETLQMRSKYHWICFSLVLCVAAPASVSAADSGYRLPPKSVVDIIDAAPTPGVSLSPDGRWMMMVESDAMPDIADVSRRMLQLGGLRIDPAANGRFATSYLKGLVLRPRDADPNDESQLIRIPLPDDPRISSVSWSHNSQYFSFSLVTKKGQQLWIGSVDEPTKPRMLTDRLNTVMGGWSWMPDGKSILCRLVPMGRGDEPENDGPPAGPNIQESSGNKSPTRTYQDLLQNPYDERLFEHYTTTQLTLFDAKGSGREIGRPQILAGTSVSPNGQYVLVTSIEKPFSYLMTYRSFPRKIQVWKLDPRAAGPDVTSLVDVPMDENIPIEGVRTGPRNHEWRSSVPATLVWAEALDGGDPNKKADFRDKFMTQTAPFADGPEELFRVQYRAAGLSYFKDPNVVLATEYDRDRRWIRASLYDLNNLSADPIVLSDRSIRDRYGDPGGIVSDVDESGHVVARQDGDWVYRVGSGASPKGNLPFIDRQNIKTLETERLWRCL
ncbi:MAG: hypothetical protein AAGI63_05565 [Planctomycetota bacterium]